MAQYTYNRFGERIKKVTYSQSKKPKVTYYLYDGHQLTAEADAEGEITAQYLYQNQRPILKLEGKTAYAIHTDHLGAPRAVTDEDQERVWSADYSPFGLVEIQNQEITLNLRLPGQYEDQESGTYYNYRRDYDPNTGRYLTSDPIGLKGGLNTYAYVGGNPLSAIDPLGLRVTFYERRIGATFLGGHTFLELTPDNPAEVQELLDMLVGPGISVFNSGGSLILSGMNQANGTGGIDLVGITNWSQDDPATARFSQVLDAPDYAVMTASCSEYSDDSLFIVNLFLAYRLYSSTYTYGSSGPLPYDGIAGASPDSTIIRGPGRPLPTIDSTIEYYNSNSFTAGILVSSGYSLSDIPDPFYAQPGLDKPVPLGTVY